MKYAGHYADMPHERAFGIAIDTETMTWVSVPPGQDIERPYTARFARQGPPAPPIGSSKIFTVHPGGKVTAN